MTRYGGRFAGGRFPEKIFDHHGMKQPISPFSLPIIFFAAVIGTGAVLLHAPFSLNGGPISWLDALFTATSATCVTGLVVVDTGTFFSFAGQVVILGLIQVGGLGIMTFTGLAFYLLRRKVSLTDRIAVGKNLLHDPSFHLGRFLLRMVVWTLVIELTGAVSLFLMAPDSFPPFSALFHAVSAFCNAGFALQASSLMQWQGHWGINLVIILLIVAGGIGFSVLLETAAQTARYIGLLRGKNQKRISWYSKVILQTTLGLIIFGWVSIYLAEFVGYHHELAPQTELVTALFQSVTCRTAGFNSLDIGTMTNVSLLIMIMLMFIGGASGSCAGGIKISTFRTLLAFITSQFKGRRQAVINKTAVDEQTVNRAFILAIVSLLIIVFATLLLTISEGGDTPHPATRGSFLELFFEAVSAYCTVGLSTGVTASLTSLGKAVLIFLMYVGRLGPIIFLAEIQHLRKEEYFSYPEEGMLIG